MAIAAGHGCSVELRRRPAHGAELLYELASDTYVEGEIVRVVDAERDLVMMVFIGVEYVLASISSLHAKSLVDPRRGDYGSFHIEVDESLKDGLQFDHRLQRATRPTT